MKITFRDRISGMTATTTSNMSLYYWAEKWGSSDHTRALFFEDSWVAYRVEKRSDFKDRIGEIFVIDIEDSELCTWRSIYHKFKRDFPDHPIHCNKAEMIYVMNEGAF